MTPRAFVEVARAADDLHSPLAAPKPRWRCSRPSRMQMLLTAIAIVACAVTLILATISKVMVRPFR